MKVVRLPGCLGLFIALSGLVALLGWSLCALQHAQAGAGTGRSGAGFSARGKRRA